MQNHIGCIYLTYHQYKFSLVWGAVKTVSTRSPPCLCKGGYRGPNCLEPAPIALWQSGDMSEKCNKKVVNFGNWFLCEFSPKTYKFLHGASLTPQKSGDEIFFKKYGQARGKRSKKCEGGVFHRQDWSQFNPLAKRIFFCKTNICEKHPLIAKKWVFILKNYLTNILPLFFWCCMVAKYLIYNFTFTFHTFF